VSNYIRIAMVLTCQVITKYVSRAHGSCDC